MTHAANSWIWKKSRTPLAAVPSARREVDGVVVIDQDKGIGCRHGGNGSKNVILDLPLPSHNHSNILPQHTNKHAETEKHPYNESKEFPKATTKNISHCSQTNYATCANGRFHSHVAANTPHRGNSAVYRQPSPLQPRRQNTASQSSAARSPSSLA